MFCKYCNVDHELPKNGDSNEFWSWVKNKNLIKNGRHVCKKYLSDFRINYKHTKRGWAIRRWNTQVKSSKKRNHPLPNYTSKDLYEWAIGQDVFHKLFKEWEESGFSYDLSPSCDRINDEKPYTFDNLRIIKLKDNIMIGAKSNKTKANMKIIVQKKMSIGVSRYDNVGNFIDSFSGAREAGRILEVDQSSIAKCCKGKLKTVKGFIWKYTEPI